MLAALPIAVILLLMVGLRWSAVLAGVFGLLAALLIAWFGYGYGISVLPALGVTRATAGALSEALFLAKV
jgi:lactate permease